MAKSCTFEKIIMSVEEFKLLVNAYRTDASYITALTAIALCNFRDDPEKCFEMINILRNPAEPMNERDALNIRVGLTGKDYIPYSYIGGAIQFNDFTPKRPYTILVKDNAHSYFNEGWAELWLHSSSSPTDRPVRLRMRRSTGAWYLTEQMLVQDLDLIVYEDEKEEDEDPWG